MNGSFYSVGVNSIDDAIGSIASYYSKHGWKPGQPVSWSATSVSDQASKLVVKKRKTDRSLKKLQKAGVVVQEQGFLDARVGLIKLSGDQGPEYRVAFDNFFVITIVCVNLIIFYFFLVKTVLSHYCPSLKLSVSY
mgnify:CR=1 FL=1